MRQVDVVIEGATRGAEHRTEVARRLLELGHHVI